MEELIKQMVKNTITRKEMAHRLGIHVSTVNNMLDKYLSFNQHNDYLERCKEQKQQYTKFRKDRRIENLKQLHGTKIVERFNTKSCHEIARIYKTNHTNIKKILLDLLGQDGYNKKNFEKRSERSKKIDRTGQKRNFKYGGDLESSQYNG